MMTQNICKHDSINNLCFILVLKGKPFVAVYKCNNAWQILFISFIRTSLGLLIKN